MRLRSLRRGRPGLLAPPPAQYWEGLLKRGKTTESFVGNARTWPFPVRYLVIDGAVPGRPVGILTERDDLTERHFAGAGFSASSTPVVVGAFDEDAVFPHVFIGNRLEADADELTREMVTLARTLVDEHPDIGAIVGECTNFVPFSQAMREATGLPVYDLHTLVTGVMAATQGHVFPRP